MSFKRTECREIQCIWFAHFEIGKFMVKTNEINGKEIYKCCSLEFNEEPEREFDNKRIELTTSEQILTGTYIELNLLGTITRISPDRWWEPYSIFWSGQQWQPYHVKVEKFTEIKDLNLNFLDRLFLSWFKIRF